MKDQWIKGDGYISLWFMNFFISAVSCMWGVFDKEFNGYTDVFAKYVSWQTLACYDILFKVCSLNKCLELKISLGW